ncbi:MAG: hypothetical protein P4L53_27015 [Candidatus Obscuribacterales bacterium]|nr:hypothetical protein [Candidatus Obscuribacterales bacterium]
MKKNPILNLTAVVFLPLILSACGKVHGERETLPVGALPASQVKAGLPERVFRDAILSYTQDKTPAASANGKTQYLSRGTDNRGARFVIQCVDDRCIMVQAYYLDSPIPKEQALSVLKEIMPDYTEPLSKVDEGVFQTGAHAVKAEIYEYGEQQAGCLIYAEGSTNSVAMVNASTLKPKELAAWFSIKLKDTSTKNLAAKAPIKSTAH